MANPFTDHPHAVGESYGEHARFAAGVGFRMIGGGLACLVHAVLPFLFVTTGSRAIRGLHDTISSPRGATPVRQPAE